MKKATLNEVLEIAPYLREADRQEILIKNTTIEKAIKTAYENSYDCRCLKLNKKVIGIFGISQQGIIWFLGADEMNKHSFYFVREGKRVTQEWLKEHKTLFNIVDSRNITHIKWLKIIGAEVNQDDYFLINDVKFYFFKLTRRKSDVIV